VLEKASIEDKLVVAGGKDALNEVTETGVDNTRDEEDCAVVRLEEVVLELVLIEDVLVEEDRPEDDLLEDVLVEDVFVE
jgi:hypothetical protein